MFKRINQWIAYAVIGALPAVEETVIERGEPWRAWQGELAIVDKLSLAGIDIQEGERIALIEGHKDVARDAAKAVTEVKFKMHDDGSMHRAMIVQQHDDRHGKIFRAIMLIRKQ